MGRTSRAGPRVAQTAAGSYRCRQECTPRRSRLLPVGVPAAFAAAEPQPGRFAAECFGVAGDDVLAVDGDAAVDVAEHGCASAVAGAEGELGGCEAAVGERDGEPVDDRLVREGDHGCRT